MVDYAQLLKRMLMKNVKIELKGKELYSGVMTTFEIKDFYVFLTLDGDEVVKFPIPFSAYGDDQFIAFDYSLPKKFKSKHELAGQKLYLTYS